jgi:hypothetical protein
MAWRVVVAINTGLDEEMHFPIDDEPALSKLEARFRTRWGINSHYLYKGVVGATDGLGIKIKRPPKGAHKCPQAFFCGRYKCFGIDVQVMVGPDCEFLGSTATRRAPCTIRSPLGRRGCRGNCKTARWTPNSISQATARTLTSPGCSPPIRAARWQALGGHGHLQLCALVSQAVRRARIWCARAPVDHSQHAVKPTVRARLT